MTSFWRWLHSLCWTLVLACLTMGCQVLFGDFKVGDNSGSAAGQGGRPGSGGAPGGGAGNVQPSGPIRVVPTADLFTSDQGAQAKLYVSLAQKPTAPVMIPVASSNSKEGVVSPGSLSFTQDDWNAPQAVTVTGVYDPQPGNQPYSVLLGPAVSDDKSFDGQSASASITNIDNDSAGVFVTPTKDLETTEFGGQAVFTVVLTKAPTAEVFIALTSSDESAGTITPSRLTFTPYNWAAPQTVVITGVNDDVAGGNRPYQITVGAPISDDSAFAALPAQTVSVTNLDNDHAGVMVTLSTGIDPTDTKRLRTSESGESATFTLTLNKEPLKDVTLTVSSSSPEGTVTPTTLTFTALNWNAPQTVTVVGIDNDSVADGNQPYQVNFGSIQSEDPAYSELTNSDLPSVNVINVDNDKADFAITLLTSVDPNDASRLQTSEKGAKASFSLVLTSKPKFPVHFGLTSTNTNEGSISPSSLDFSDSNWYVPQTVTVTGLNDDTKDGNVVYAVVINAPATEDLAYQKLQSTDVKVVNLDDDVAGITPPKLLSGVDGGTKLITREPGESAGTATFSISLTSRPKKDVKVPVSSSDGSEGRVSPAILTFTPANYATAQTVTVIGVDDAVVDGNQAYTVNIGQTMSDDTDYQGLTQSVKVTNQDDDSAYIVPTPGYAGTTTEPGGSTTFGISLHSQPTADVTLTFTSSDTNEGKVSPSSLKYTSSNWSTPQNITVTGVNDDIADGDKGYSVSIKGTNTTDPNYQVAATTLNLTNKDDDNASLKVTAAANLQTTEAGGKVTFTVVLSSQPTANVNVAVTSSATKEGTVSASSLSFTTSNWSTAQTVTVTGVDDSVADGNQTYTVTLKTSGNDAKYTALPASTVSIVNKDDDQAGIVVTPTTCATTPGTTATFSVVLKSQPLSAVSVALSSDTPTEGKVSPATLSFSATTWNVAQQVTVTGQDDLTTSTMTSYKIVTAAAVSTDVNYNGFNAADVACINTTPDPPPPPPPMP